MTLTDCDRETLENLRQEAVLNSHSLLEAGSGGADGARAHPQDFLPAQPFSGP